MDLLQKWSQIKREAPFPSARVPAITMPEMVQSLLQRYVQMWWAGERSLPKFPVTYHPKEQADHEKELDQLVKGLIFELNHIPQAKEEQQAQQARLRSNGMAFAGRAFHLEQRHLAFIESSGMLEAIQVFARMARQFDPHISGNDIYQASRNVLTMNFMQLLLGLPVEITPAVFAYSMLYPYTDNYLDNPSISHTTKVAFNHRFQLRLQGEEVRLANPHETTISRPGWHD